MNSRQRISLAICSILAVLITARLYFAYRSHPQLPASAEVFQTVDALFTAVTAHNTQRLADCQQRLAKYKDRGSLPSAAAQRLDRIISLAQSGDWTTAAHRLYDFMQAQQRKSPPPNSRPQLTAMSVR